MNILSKMIEIIKNKHVVLFWSGGYDSTVLYNLIIKNKLYNLAHFYFVIIKCPQNIYNDNKVQETVNFLSTLPIKIYNIEPKERISSDVEYYNACPICKDIRRNAIKLVLNEINQSMGNENDLILMTGHNLDDLVSYYIENVVNILDKKGFDGHKLRFIESTNKIFSLFEYSDKIKIYRPLIEYSKKQLLTIFSQSEYERLTICDKKCFWIKQRKRLLQEYLNAIKIEIDYNTLVEKFKKEFIIPSIEDFRSISLETYLM